MFIIPNIVIIAYFFFFFKRIFEFFYFLCKSAKKATKKAQENGEPFPKKWTRKAEKKWNDEPFPKKTDRKRGEKEECPSAIPQPGLGDGGAQHYFETCGKHPAQSGMRTHRVVE